MFGNDIWKRKGEDEIEKGPYVQLVALFTLISIGIVATGSFFSLTWPFTWTLLIITFVGMIIGVLIFSFSKNPTLSAIGVTVMSGSSGLMIGPLVAEKSHGVVLEAVLITAGIVGIMSLVGIMFPKVFNGFGPYLLAALTALIVAQFSQIFLVFLGFAAAIHMPILYWIGIVLFALYIAFDWARAMKLPRTVNNAIQVAGSLTLDVVNIFLRVMGLKSDD